MSADPGERPGGAEALHPGSPETERFIPQSDIGERFIPHAFKGDIAEAEHLGRYVFASAFAPNRIALDAGCGMGYGSAILARAGAVEVFGFDIDQAAADEATKLFGSIPEISRFWASDIMATGLPHRHFGLITCFEVIEHVADPERALDELKRVLFPGGVLVCSTPNRGAYADYNPFHIAELTTAELETALRDRFEHVAILPQQVHLATLIAGRDGHEAADVEAEIPGVIRKVEATDPDQAPYSVAVASDEPLPGLEALTVLTGPLSIKLWLDAQQAWEDRARAAEGELAASNIRVGFLEQELADARSRRPLRRLARALGLGRSGQETITNRPDPKGEKID